MIWGKGNAEGIAGDVTMEGLLDEVIPKIVSDKNGGGGVPLRQAALRAAWPIQRQIGLGLIQL